MAKEAEVAQKFLAEVLNHKEVGGLLSNEHFSVDGMGLDEELPRQGRLGRTTRRRPQRRAR